MAAATTALVRQHAGAGVTGGSGMMMALGTPNGTSAPATPFNTGYGQSPQATFSLQQGAYAACSAQLSTNHFCNHGPGNYYQQQNCSLQRTFYQNLTPEPSSVPSTVTSQQQTSNVCEATTSITLPAAMTTTDVQANNSIATAEADLSLQLLTVRRPSSGSSRSRPSSACSSVTNAQPSATISTVGAFINSTTTTTTAATTSTTATTNEDILVIRDPFEDEDLSRPRCCSTSTQVLLFNQRPPQYINTGNPIHSGGQLDLPRHLRVPYPESAYRACAAANKNLAMSRTVMPIPVLLPPLSGTFGHRTGCLFGPNTVAMESSGVFGNPHQQLSGGSTNFGMLRNSRVQSGASPGCPPQQLNVPSGTASAPGSAQGYGNSCCAQPPTPQMPAGCMQRGCTEYPVGPHYVSPGGLAGQSYFGGATARSEPGATSVMNLNGGQMGMMNMNAERTGPVMGMMGVGQQQLQQNGGATTGKRGSNKRTKANKAAVAVSAFTDEQQQLLARRKQQTLLSSGPQHPMLPGMVSALPSQDFYMPQGICGAGGLPPPAVQPQQQQSLMPMITAAGGSGGAAGQFDNFDIRPSTSTSCIPMPNFCSPMAPPLGPSGTPPQQSTSQMIASSMMMTRCYAGAFEQNGAAADSFQAVEQPSSTVPTVSCLPAASQRFGNAQPDSNCCTPDSQQQLHYGASRSNGVSSGNGNALSSTTINSSGDSFTVLNGTTNRSIASGSKQRCAGCTEEFRGDRPGIQCTASGQGCRRFFHQECSELLPDAFRAIIAEPRAEWICPECLCRQQTQLTFA